MAENNNMDDMLHFNGIDATSGAYDLPPMSREELWKIVKGGEVAPEQLEELRFRYQQARMGHYGVKEGVDPKNLAESGWGVIFASDADPAVKEALDELLKLREKQAGEYFRSYSGAEGHREEESKTKFLARHGAGPGPADPEKVPYYLLIVGSPDRIPYRFQTQLDVQYAVGRIHFDTLDEYANYAQSVVAAESGQVKLARTMNFFGVANEDDQATQLSAKHLVDPLYEKFKNSYSNWDVTAFTRDQATGKQLDAILGGQQTPAFLFTASHGASFPKGDNLQRKHNGALITQDWPGPQKWQGGPLDPEKHYFSGEHLGSDRNLLGLIAFFFACYGGGTPRMDEFSAQAFRDSRRQIADNNFLAYLPSKMLSQSKGGALAVIGHVERAWGYSFVWPKAGEQLAVFESTIQRLLDGHPVGSAIEYFNERYAELSTVLSDELEEIKIGGKRENPYELAGMWTANNDARGYAIIGDPAVRMQVAGEAEESSQRPVIEVTYQAPPSQGSIEPESQELDVAGVAAQAEEQPVADLAATDFTPRPELGRRLAKKFPELEEKMLEDWIRQIERGYKNHDQVFQRILDTFLSNHRTTVTMYWILFVVGLGLFIAAAVLAVVMDGNYIPSLIFGGLGVVTFLSYFVGRSVQSVEENLEYITWLGLIYNTYWTRQAWTFETEGAQEILKDATDEALAQMEHMVDKHANARRLRPSIKEEES